MPSARQLIVNADDFGLTPGINRGILLAHDRGLVTSASLMVRGAAAGEAVQEAARRPGLSLGLHVDLCEWEYRDDAWVCRYAVAAVDDAAAVTAEVARQLHVFRSLAGKDPTHLDSHQHVHREEPVRSVLLVTARLLGIPLRHFTPGVVYCGNFYGQSNKGYAYHEGVSVEALTGVIRSLPPGTTELCCHPGLGDDADSVYRVERTLECQALCDPRVRQALAEEGIQLISFAGFTAQAAG